MVKDCFTCSSRDKVNPDNSKASPYECCTCRRISEEDTTPTNWSPRGTTEECFGCDYYYGEIDQCMYGEPDVPDNLIRKCKLIEQKGDKYDN